MDFKSTLFNDPRTVYSLNDLALLLRESNTERLKQKVHYYAQRKIIKNLRRGIYAKSRYKPEELGGKIFRPSYLSLEYVLLKEGVIFQYSRKISMVSYLSRTLTVDGREYAFRKLKNEILLNTAGIRQAPNGINIACVERAVMDTLYLNKEFYFDNLTRLDQRKIEALLPVYNCKALLNKVKRLL